MCIRDRWGAGIVAALASNLINNLPAGLIAGSVGQIADLPAQTAGALLIGVDLGPNLSITGSLATLLWLIAVRREGQHVGALRFLKPVSYTHLDVYKRQRTMCFLTVVRETPRRAPTCA